MLKLTSEGTTQNTWTLVNAEEAINLPLYWQIKSTILMPTYSVMSLSILESHCYTAINIILVYRSYNIQNKNILNLLKYM